VADIRKQIAKTKDNDIRNQLFERAGKLSGGVALLRVGGATETEREFYKTRCEDAVRVIRAAMESGVVAGGGWAYIYAAQTLQQTALANEGYDDDALARSLLVAALCQPARAILRNSGYDAAAIVPIYPPPTPMRNTALGFDVTQGDMVDMFAANIVDPVNVLIAAFRAALSAAIMILTTEALIHKPRDNRDKEVTLDP
jgi:chaperonin GroEL